MPALAVTGAVVLGVLSLAVLLVFVHHTSTSIQVATITARTARRVAEAVTSMFPEPFGEGAGPDAAEIRGEWRSTGGGHEVQAQRSGSVQSIDIDGLGDRLPAGTRVDLLARPGGFVCAGGTVALVYPPPGQPETAHVQGAVTRVVSVADDRDSAQDVDFGLQRIADVAVRALSPGVNDPGTAASALAHADLDHDRWRLNAALGEIRRAELVGSVSGLVGAFPGVERAGP